MKRFLIAALKSLAGIEDTDYPYYHVSNNPNPPAIRTDEHGLKHDDPNGIYLFYKEKEVIDNDWISKKYRWDAKIKGTVRDIHSIPFDEWLKEVGVKNPYKYAMSLKSAKVINDVEHLQEKLTSYYEGEPDREITAEYGYMLLKEKLKDRKSLTAFFKRKGIKAFGDSATEGNAIWWGEPQVIVLDPSIIEWGPREENSIDDKVYRITPN